MSENNILVELKISQTQHIIIVNLKTIINKVKDILKCFDIDKSYKQHFDYTKIQFVSHLSDNISNYILQTTDQLLYRQRLKLIRLVQDYLNELISLTPKIEISACDDETNHLTLCSECKQFLHFKKPFVYLSDMTYEVTIN